MIRTKLVDGTEVVQEVHAKPKTNYSSAGQGPGFFGNVDDVNGNKPGLEGPALGKIWFEIDLKFFTQALEIQFT